ncbi:MAG: pilus assembly protein [Pirellulaceae bacterium]|nr:pilus assembly protein [Pirellulaceae bacterium]
MFNHRSKKSSFRQLAQGRRFSRSGRRGAAAVECALVLPIAVLMFLGVAELGQGLTASTTLTAAVREAGRLACMDFKDFVPAGMTPNQKIEQDVKRLLMASGVPQNAISVQIVHAEGNSLGQPFDLDHPSNYQKLFRLEVTVPYNQISSYPLRMLADRDITSSIVMRRGRVASMSD